MALGGDAATSWWGSQTQEVPLSLAVTLVLVEHRRAAVDGQLGKGVAGWRWGEMQPHPWGEVKPSRYPFPRQ